MSFDCSVIPSAVVIGAVVVKPPVKVSIPEGGITESVVILASTTSLEVAIDTSSTLGVFLNDTFTILNDNSVTKNSNYFEFLFFTIMLCVQLSY